MVALQQPERWRQCSANPTRNAATERAVDKAQQMQERIKTLEQILDAEHPNWRQS